DAIITNQSEILFSPYKPTYQYTNNKGALIYDNGPVFNSTGTGAGGANESIMQSTSLGMSTYGFGFQLSGSTRNRVAEDFSVNATSWTIDSIIFFGYQTGSPTSPSTFTEVNLRIWDGVPDAPGSNVIWGDTTTNVLTNSYWSGVYRVQEGSSGGNTRPIMKLVCSTTGLSLPAGTYWVDYQAAGSGSSGPWAPPIVITGQANTGNAIQRSSYVWAPIVDVAPQGLPFLIYGTCIGGFTDDIGVTSITAPTSSATLTNAENISVVITNFASNAQTGFPISYSINGQIPVTETFTGTLAPLSSTNFTFSTTADFSNPGQIYTIKAYTDLLNDQYQANDTSKSIIQNLFGVICSANATNCDEFIDSLMFSNISNLGSGCGLLNGYSDFTTDTAQVNIGSSYILDVYNPTPYAKDIVGAWFDWNQDGNFNGPGEFYTVPTLDGGHYFSTNITIPNWALNGPTRMRVRIQWQGTLDPCGNTNYGEVEDYTVNVMGSGIACDVETSSIDMNSNIALGTITPQATFKNLGYAAQTFNVTMNISGGYTSTKTINSLSPGATQQISFDPWTPS
ncbi:MAG TPA: GEVED domain-containing protein, partial [Bacteroidales bacterium]|nr:GEVED domain-containing protein [Bacteroidales bacterium]